MARTRRVAFARINRRSATESLEPRDFGVEMRVLANSRLTRAEFRNREWIAADLELDSSGDFMTGVLGFVDAETLREFEDKAFSWLKGETRIEQGASERTMVPFAIDLRESRRWVAFGISQRIRSSSFASGFEATLNSAVGQIKQLPSDWEVDLVTGIERVEHWLLQHPGVVKFKREVKLHNPVDHIDDDREEMRALGARVKREEYTAGRSKTLNVRDNPEFDAKLEGLETGDLDVIISAREGTTTVTFSSKRSADQTYVEEFGEDLRSGMELMLDAVREYSAERATQLELGEEGDTK